MHHTGGHISGTLRYYSMSRRDFNSDVISSTHPLLGIIAIAALLGLAILILLGILGYCFLKGKKSQPQRHQRVAVNGSQVTTMEDTERLVYNATTKPI